MDRTGTLDGQSYWVATRAHTARCGCGKTGSATVESSVRSFISPQDAAIRAHALAECEARRALLCKWVASATATGPCGREETRSAESDLSPEAAFALALIAARDAAIQWCVDHELYFVSTQSATYTAHCPNGTTGDDQTATAEFTAASAVSQGEADALASAGAQAAAQAAAQGALSCMSQVVYYSTQSYTANCPTGYSGFSATRDGEAQSLVSQQDADSQAMALAVSNAEAALDCTQTTYTVTADATANCPEGTTGTSQSASATVTSSVSYDDAYSQAYSAALAQAESQLFCTAISYTGYGQYTATCPGGYTGSPVTSEASATSSISQADADAQAQLAAYALATSQLSCTPDE